jgi:hypothetical protein
LVVGAGCGVLSALCFVLGAWCLVLGGQLRGGGRGISLIPSLLLAILRHAGTPSCFA